MSATVEVPTPPLAPTTAVIVPWRRAMISSRLEASRELPAFHAQNREQTVGGSSRDKGSASTVPCSGVHRCHNAGGAGPAQQNNGNGG